MDMEPASIRYKNPGAMWGSAIATKWGATKSVKLNDGTGQGNTIASFPTYVQGICAQLDLWRSSKHYKNKKFKDAIRTWSGGNHVDSYIKFVTQRVPGITPNTIMNDSFWRSEKGIQFLKAQAWHEAGKPYPAPDEDWYEARRIVFNDREPNEAPAPVEEITTKELPEVRPAAKSKVVSGSVLTWLTANGSAIWNLFPTLDNPYTLAALVLILTFSSVGLYLVLSGRIELRNLVTQLKGAVE
jgi:hypothetical protein